MTRGILILIIIDMVFTSQISLGLGDTEDSNKYIAGSPSSLSDLSRESVESEKHPKNESNRKGIILSPLPSSANQQESVTSNSTTQYLLGVIEYNEGNVELAKIWFQQAYESLEAEEGKIAAQKTQTFGRALDKSSPQATPAKVQFPEGYKVDVYYRDGWYIQPKNSSAGEKVVPTFEKGSALRNSAPRKGQGGFYSFLPGSTYKIRLEVEDEHPTTKEINIGMKVIAALIMVSWVMAR
ncbi:hypothetical protein H8E77_22745 [bacterium]|nr:hypothetical protein [bacterium]